MNRNYSNLHATAVESIICINLFIEMDYPPQRIKRSLRFFRKVELIIRTTGG